MDVNEANIRLDDLKAPEDNTDLDASITAHGLLPKLPNVATQFLDGTGVWATLVEADISDLGTYADAGANSDITSLTGLTTALSIAQGGTGLTTGALTILSTTTVDFSADADTTLYTVPTG